MAEIFRNRWPECSGIGGRNGAEWVAEIKRNIQNEENDQKWASEAKRRLEELRSGKVKSISGEEVFKKIWKRFEK